VGHTLAAVPADLPVVEQPPHLSGALLDLLARHVRVHAESVLGALGLRPRHLIALSLLRDHGSAGQQLLAELLSIDRTNLVGLLNELEEESWIVRRRSAQDRRRHVVELTDSGREKLAHDEMLLAAIENEVFSGLDSGERETLYGLLLKASEQLVPAALRSGGSLRHGRSDSAAGC
jgi:MarR family transcriptional regulator, lower aerobic nicotinate degradation pathway regulator